MLLPLLHFVAWVETFFAAFPDVLFGLALPCPASRSRCQFLKRAATAFRGLRCPASPLLSSPRLASTLRGWRLAGLQGGRASWGGLQGTLERWPSVSEQPVEQRHVFASLDLPIVLVRRRTSKFKPSSAC